MPNSISKKLDILKAGDEIIKVNNKSVNDIKSYRHALLNFLKNKSNKRFIKFETKSNKTLVLNLKDILDEEENLRIQNKYPISETFKFYSKKKISVSKKKKRKH